MCHIVPRDVTLCLRVPRGGGWGSIGESVVPRCAKRCQVVAGAVAHWVAQSFVRTADEGYAQSAAGGADVACCPSPSPRRDGATSRLARGERLSLVQGAYRAITPPTIASDV